MSKERLSNVVPFPEHRHAPLNKAELRNLLTEIQQLDARIAELDEEEALVKEAITSAEQPPAVPEVEPPESKKMRILRRLAGRPKQKTAHRQEAERLSQKVDFHLNEARQLRRDINAQLLSFKKEAVH